MTQFNYWRCDECEKILRNAECSPIQLMFTLIANYDTKDGYKAHFCSKDCLKKYVDEKVKEHYSLPNVSDGDRTEELETLGEVHNNQERK